MGYKAVVVDDDRASAVVVAKLLRTMSWDVEICVEPASATALALAPDIDLVSLDLTMPGMDGYELLSLIRSHESTRRAPSVPVIAVTGRTTIDEKADALASGFTAHLGKPVLLGPLRSALARVVLLRSETYRTRYSTDRASILGRLAQLPGAMAVPRVQAVAGLTLAVEQQGRSALHRAFGSALAGRNAAARTALVALRRLASDLGARCLLHRVDEIGASLDSDRDILATAVVLARAELDRVLFTLRELALSSEK